MALFSITPENTSGILGTSANLIAGLMPLIKIFIGVFIALIIVGFLREAIPYALGRRRIKKEIGFLRGLGYTIGGLPRGITREEEIVKRLKKAGYTITPPY